MTDPMPLPMPPSVMTSPAVHPAEIRAERENLTPENEPQTEVVQELNEAVSECVASEQTEAVSECVASEQTEAVSECVASEQTEAVSECVASEQTEAVSECVASEQTEAVSEPDLSLNQLIISVSEILQSFISENDEKTRTLNRVVQQLNDLGLTDNSAVEHLQLQQSKYDRFTEQLQVQFENMHKSIVAFNL